MCEKKLGSYQSAEQHQSAQQRQSCPVILRYSNESNDLGHSETRPHESFNISKTEVDVKITSEIRSATSELDLSVGILEIDSPRPTEGPLPTQMTHLSGQTRKDLKRYERLFNKARRKKRACSFSGCA